MADYLVTDTELTSVANAIRTKTGGNSNLSWPTGFASAIGDLLEGGNAQSITFYFYYIDAATCNELYGSTDVAATYQSEYVSENQGMAQFMSDICDTNGSGGWYFEKTCSISDNSGTALLSYISGFNVALSSGAVVTPVAVTYSGLRSKNPSIYILHSVTS